MSLTLELRCPEQRDIHVNFLPNGERKLVAANAERPALFVHSEDGHHRIRGLFDCNKRVLDTDSYRIERAEGGGMSVSDRNDVPVTGCTGEASTGEDGSPGVRPYRATLVVVLESPHRDEFCQAGEAISSGFPAMGTTGTNLRGRLVDVIQSAPDLEEAIACQLPVRVVLCNPIQFQASLLAVGADELGKECRGLLKLMVWCALWNVESIRCDFLARLKLASPNWILNGCVLQGGLNWEISSFLTNMVEDAHIYGTVHPAGWKPSWMPRCERVQ